MANNYTQMTAQQLWVRRWRMHCVLQLFRKPSPGNTDNDFGLFVCLLSAQMTSTPCVGTARTVGPISGASPGD